MGMRAHALPHMVHPMEDHVRTTGISIQGPNVIITSALPRPILISTHINVSEIVATKLLGRLAALFK